MKERIRFVSIEFSEDDRSLANELILVEQRISYRVFHELKSGHEAIHTKCDVVVHSLFARRAVPLCTELIETTQISFLRGNCPVGLEEHVLIQMRKPGEFRSFGVCAVLHIELHRNKRN